MNPCIPTLWVYIAVHGKASKMIGSLFFIFNRLVEIVFLIPIIGMMVCLHPHDISQITKNLTIRGKAYFVDGYLKSNHITPVYILVLFIVSVIAIFYALDTLIRLHTTKRSAPLRNNPRPPFLRRLHRLRLRTALHRHSRLQPLESERHYLRLTGPVRAIRLAVGEPACL